VNVETEEQSKQWMHTHSPSKTKKLKQTSACQNADSNCFLEQQRSADGGIHVTRDHNNVRSVLRNTKKKKTVILNVIRHCQNPLEYTKKRHRAIQNPRRGVLLYKNARPHTAARIRALLEHFNWELFDHHTYSPDLIPSNYHLFTCLQNWLDSQPFNNIEELMAGVKMWLNSQATDFSDTGMQKLIPRYKRLNSGGGYVEK
jgi:hypothetical protein